MLEVVVKEDIAASADRVWALIRDFDDTVLPSGVIESCTVEGDGEGAVRTLRSGGVAIRERLDRRDDAQRRLRYSVVGDNPLPIHDYASVMTVCERGPEQCTLEWRGEFEPVTDGAQVKGVIMGLYVTGISALKRRLGV